MLNVTFPLHKRKFQASCGRSLFRLPSIASDAKPHTFVLLAAAASTMAAAASADLYELSGL